MEVYCGTDGTGRLISKVGIPSSGGRPRAGRYSTEPLMSSLSVSHGTLTPTFNSYTDDYTVPDVSNADTRITINVTPSAGYAVEFYEATEDDSYLGLVVYSLGPGGPPTGLSDDCTPNYVDHYGSLPKLTDADPNTTGFQVDLYDGENYVFIMVYPTAICGVADVGYHLTITRAEGSISVIRPNRPPTRGVDITSELGHDMTSSSPYVGMSLSVANVSSIRDRDGMTNPNFSYQWFADDTEITGANSSSYRVKSADLGKILKVRVSFTDDRGTEETLEQRQL